MKSLCNLFVLILASIALASCGGGGSGSNSAFGGPGNSTTLTLSATTTTLPVNPFSIAQEQSGTCPGNYLGSPYIAEVTVTWRQNNGQLVSGTTPVNVSVTPTTVIQFSTLNSTNSNGGSCSDQFHTLLGSGPVNVTAGVGTIFVHSSQVPGQGVVTVTATDPVSKQTITAQLTITVAGGASGAPASVTVTSSGGAYVASSGGISSLVSATVTDGSGALVADPSGYDNVQFSITGPANADSRLSAVNAAGQTVTGTTIATITHHGVAGVTFLPGNQQGPVQVQATIDRGDGNVDNGIQDAASATTTVVVSDGKLYSLTLTSPGSNAPSILVNRVSTQATLINQGSTPIPPDPNATYSFTVSAIGTDRQGNPVLPGTQIKFGSIDSPVDAVGNYQISGQKGDPQEGGTLFSAADGQFTSAGGGAGPGDTLLVFGKLVVGNSDLESAATVGSVQNAQNLTVTTPFNLNDTTGTSVNYGPVLPYIVGRAQIGNIISPATTNSIGVASTTLNYPVSALGHVAGVWAQATGTDNITGGTKIITDINLFAFPGVAPAKIVISPNPIPGNLSTTVYACIYDALGSPLQGVDFQFSFTNMGAGSGTLDGINGAGLVPDLTDASGCVATTVSTTGIAGSSSSGGSTGTPSLTFTAGNTTATAPIAASGNLILLAKPSQLGGTGGTVTLTLLNGNGTPVPGAQLTGSCTNAGIASGPGVTNSAGQTTVVITANLNQPNAAGTGSCTFTTSTGSPTVTVTLQGVDPCKSGLSPPPMGCTSSGGTNYNLTVQLNAQTTGYGSVSSTPTGVGCAMTSATNPVSCTGAFASGTSVTVTAAPTAPSTGVKWGGACASAGTALAATVTLTANSSCTATFQP
ncbi:MAG: beta strand repeat-containing protein [Rudaea sp.]